MPGPGTYDWKFIVPQASKNILLNPGFELADPFVWTLGSGVGTTSSTCHSGRSAVGYVGPAVVLVSQSFVFQSTTGSLIASAWVFILNPEDVLYLRIRDGGGALVETQTDQSILGRYQRIICQVSATPGDTYTFQVEADDTLDGEVRVDDCQLEGTWIVTTYFDGDEPGCFWMGLPNLSHSVRPLGCRTGGVEYDLSWFLTITGMQGVGPAQVSNVNLPFGLMGGEVYQRTIKLARDFIINGQMVSSNMTDLEVRVATLAQFLGADLSLPQKPGALVFAPQDRQELLIEAEYVNGLEYDSLSGLTLTNLPIAFHAPDPYFRARTRHFPLDLNVPTELPPNHFLYKPALELPGQWRPAYPIPSGGSWGDAVRWHTGEVRCGAWVQLGGLSSALLMGGSVDSLASNEDGEVEAPALSDDGYVTLISETSWDDMLKLGSGGDPTLHTFGNTIPTTTSGTYIVGTKVFESFVVTEAGYANAISAFLKGHASLTAHAKLAVYGPAPTLLSSTPLLYEGDSEVTIPGGASQAVYTASIASPVYFDVGTYHVAIVADQSIQICRPETGGTGGYGHDTYASAFAGTFGTVSSQTARKYCFYVTYTRDSGSTSDVGLVTTPAQISMLKVSDPAHSTFNLGRGYFHLDFSGATGRILAGRVRLNFTHVEFPRKIRLYWFDYGTLEDTDWPDQFMLAPASAAFDPVETLLEVPLMNLYKGQLCDGKLVAIFVENERVEPLTADETLVVFDAAAGDVPPSATLLVVDSAFDAAHGLLYFSTLYPGLLDVFPQGPDSDDGGAVNAICPTQNGIWVGGEWLQWWDGSTTQSWPYLVYVPNDGSSPSCPVELDGPVYSLAYDSANDRLHVAGNFHTGDGWDSFGIIDIPQPDLYPSVSFPLWGLNLPNNLMPWSLALRNDGTLAILTRPDYLNRRYVMLGLANEMWGPGGWHEIGTLLEDTGADFGDVSMPPEHNNLTWGADGKLYLCGKFTSVSPGAASFGLAAWNGATWAAVPGRDMNPTDNVAGTWTNGIKFDSQGIGHVTGIIWNSFTNPLPGAVGNPSTVVNGYLRSTGSGLEADTVSPSHDWQAYPLVFVNPYDDSLFLAVNWLGYRSDPWWAQPTIVPYSATAPAPPRIHIAGYGGLGDNPTGIGGVFNGRTGQRILFQGLAIAPQDTLHIDTTPGQVRVWSDKRGDLSRYVAPGSDLATFCLLPGENYLYVMAYYWPPSITIDWYDRFVDLSGAAETEGGFLPIGPGSD